MLDQLGFAFGITGPILALLALGWISRQIGLISDAFIGEANAFVFNVAMPAMLYLAITSKPLAESLNWRLTLVGFVGTLILVGVLLLVRRLVPFDERGVFVQGSYRGNLAIVGIALAMATYGDDILSQAALYIAVVTTSYNIIAVWVLSAKGALWNILKNPILIGILAGLVATLLGIQLPAVVTRSGQYLADMTLPVALLCIGASVQFRSMLDHGRSLTLAVLFKLLVSPVLLVTLGYFAALPPEQLGLLFFMAASPTASASYIMARQMTQHGALAAEIIAVTTTLGVLSYTIGLALLRGQGLI